jgi:hypothetical protein
MGETCGTYGGQEFWWGDLMKRDQLEDLGIDGRIILRWIFKKWDGKAWNGLVWFRWRAFVNAVMNVRIS